MSKFRAPSPALVVAMIALFVALGGTGYSAIQSTGTDHAKATAKKKTVKRGPRGRRGPRGLRGLTGPQGPQGPQGTAGTNGTNGTNGSPAFGAILGRGVNAPATPSFFAPSGQLNANANENNVSAFTPNATMTASGLSVSLSVAPGLADSRTFTLRIGNANTALTCTVPGGTTLCDSGNLSVTIPPSSLISIGSTSTGAPDPTDVRFGWRATLG